jgi:hypothetical protein
MQRVRFIIASIVVVLLALAALAHGPLAIAQNATPGASAANPIVGTWIINDPTGTPSITAFTADGIVIDTETSGGTGVGSWTATGADTAAFTMVIPLTGAGQAGIVVIRATVHVDASGKTLTAPYTYTVTGNTGAVLASGKGQVTGTRVPVEPASAVGTPMAGFPTWVPQPPSTPAASPTS